MGCATSKDGSAPGAPVRELVFFIEMIEKYRWKEERGETGRQEAWWKEVWW